MHVAYQALESLLKPLEAIKKHFWFIKETGHDIFRFSESFWGWAENIFPALRRLSKDPNKPEMVFHSPMEVLDKILMDGKAAMDCLDLHPWTAHPQAMPLGSS